MTYEIYTEFRAVTYIKARTQAEAIAKFKAAKMDYLKRNSTLCDCPTQEVPDGLLTIDRV